MNDNSSCPKGTMHTNYKWTGETEAVPGELRPLEIAAPVGSLCCDALVHHSFFWPLFEHMSREHDLTLTESEMAEIVRIAASLTKNDQHNIMTRSKIELEEKHGTPAQFEEAVWKAAKSGEVTIDEARAAVAKYNAEYKSAPAW